MATIGDYESLQELSKIAEAPRHTLDVYPGVLDVLHLPPALVVYRAAAFSVILNVDGHAAETVRRQIVDPQGASPSHVWPTLQADVPALVLSLYREPLTRTLFIPRFIHRWASASIRVHKSITRLSARLL